MRSIQAGQLNKRITFQQNTGTQDATGQRIDAWADVITVWAAITPLSGKQLELARAQTVTSTATHQIRIRWNEALTNQLTYRVKYAAGFSPTDTAPVVRYFRINSILDTEERHFEMRLVVTEDPKANA